MGRHTHNNYSTYKENVENSIDEKLILVVEYYFAVQYIYSPSIIDWHAASGLRSEGAPG